MPLAKPIDSNHLLATYGVFPIAEIGAVDPSVALSESTDIHFGLNAQNSDIEEAAKQIGIYNDDESDYACADLGPRVIDIARRGGRVAEYNWYILGRKQKLERSKGGTQITKFDCVTLEWFEGLNSSLEAKNTRDESLEDYPSYARYGGAKPGEIGFTKFYGTKRYTGTTKDSAEMMHAGVRWSKTALEYALASGHAIHMHLDGLGDIQQIVKKDVSHAWNFGVTGLEVRYVYRHWERFKSKVRFYNGYEFLGSSCDWSQAKVMEVEVPWKSALPPNRPSTDPVVEALKKKGTWV